MCRARLLAADACGVALRVCAAGGRAVCDQARRVHCDALGRHGRDPRQGGEQGGARHPVRQVVMQIHD